MRYRYRNKENRKEFSGIKKIYIINGPNLNFLGIREPAHYGTENYEALCAKIQAAATAKGDTVEIFQNNSEGSIIDRIQAAYSDGTEGLIINPGAYTHALVEESLMVSPLRYLLLTTSPAFTTWPFT